MTTHKIRTPRILIIGHGRHGKDAFAEALHKIYGWTYSSSSMKAAEIFIFDKLKEKYGYKTFEECYEDRHNRRTEWYNLITDYNKNDRARLAKGIMEESDMYVGMRDKEEIQECLKQGVFDLVIWVYRPGTAHEPRDSFNIDLGDCHFCVFNDGTLEELEEKARIFADQWIVNQLFKSTFISPVEASIKISEMKPSIVT